jgi:hypothetical protein
VELAKGQIFVAKVWQIDCRSTNEDKAMNHFDGFILDSGSYPWDVVS